MAACSEPGCGGPARKRGLCNKHYQRLRKSGGLHDQLKATSAEIDAFLERAMNYHGNHCLLWPFARNGWGYGVMKSEGRLVLVSSWVCEQVSGSRPTSRHEVAHSCGKGHEGCINPQHLEWKTHRDNEDDKLVHGTRAPIHVKLPARETARLRTMYATGKYTQKWLAGKFGISYRQATRIVTPEAVGTAKTGVSYHGN